MKKAILLCGMLLALTATVASAQGVNLNWAACYGDGPVTGNKASACTSNSGTNIMVASYVTPAAGILQASGAEIVIDLASQSATLPAWWQFFTAGSCRTASLTVNVAFAGSVCSDYWLGGGGGGIAAYKNVNYGANTARIIVAWAVPASSISDLAGSTEYFAMNFAINNAKTVGLGSCAGCSTPVCLVLSSIKITTPVVNGHPLDDTVLTGGGSAPNSNFITWQGGGTPTTNLGTGCPAATPTHNATWGSVKALYR